LLQVIANAKRYAETEASILIEGETGTGKELLAQSIHNASRRSSRPFLGVNCSALSEPLLESELFGYEEGAFTGARRGGKIGLFEMAHGGSLFLDEIADISPTLQVKLLRVIEEKEIMRLGGDRIVPVDVRIISSSQRNLYGGKAEPRFRRDLYFRLGTLRLRLPPLRQRPQDLPVLVEALFAKHGRPVEGFSARAWSALVQHSWPGNVRELDSLVRMYLALTDNPTFDETLFLSALAEICKDVIEAEGDEEGVRGTLKDQLRRYEKKIIEHTLREARYSRSETARRLGISVNSLWRKAPKIDD
jgi:propionate catabolism operon transcriptional regulator